MEITSRATRRTRPQPLPVLGGDDLPRCVPEGASAASAAGTDGDRRGL